MFTHRRTARHLHRHSTYNEGQLAAGALIIGKTNMHELAFGITSDNVAFGAVANPFDTTTFAGGSSGGTASAIAAGLAPAGLGTDTGGSVRIPAALTGTVGFRPSNGRYPLSGVTPISHTRDTIGLIAWTVADLILLDNVIDTQGSAVPSLAAPWVEDRLRRDPLELASIQKIGVSNPVVVS